MASFWRKINWSKPKKKERKKKTHEEINLKNKNKK